MVRSKLMKDYAGDVSQMHEKHVGKAFDVMMLREEGNQHIEGAGREGRTSAASARRVSTCIFQPYLEHFPQ